MFMTMNPDKIKNQYAAYTLSDTTGALIYVGIGKAVDILNLPGAPLHKIPAGATVNVVISSIRDDIMQAANDALWIAEDAARRDLIDAITKAVRTIQNPPTRAGRPLECVETSERFYSVAAATVAHGVSYAALHNHLKGAVGYKTVKGRTYRYL